MINALRLLQLLPLGRQLNSHSSPHVTQKKTVSLGQRFIGSLLSAGLMFGSLLGLSAAAMAEEGVEEIEEVIVTGSRINRPNVTSSSPVTVLDAEAFEVFGAVDTIDLINQLPQAFVSQDLSFANGANGTSTINLRGLGSLRTLVLANGKRLPFGSPTSGGFAADVNLIPAPLVERVEIVTGGASAVYGSDAIAGVANFILKKNFEGFEMTGCWAEIIPITIQDLCEKLLVQSVRIRFRVGGTTTILTIFR